MPLWGMFEFDSVQGKTGATELAMLSGLQSAGTAAAIYDRNNVLLAFTEPYRHLFPVVSHRVQVGMTFRELLHAFWEGGAAFDASREQWIDQLEREFRDFSRTVSQQVQDGRTMMSVKQAMPDGGVLSIVQDVTERQDAQVTRSASQGTYINFARNVADWFWETDVNHRFVRPTGGLGMSDGELSRFLGKTRWEALEADVDNDPVWFEHRQALIAHRPFREFRYQNVLSDGRVRHSRISGIPRFDGNGRFLGYWGIGIDETALAEAGVRAADAEIRGQEAIDSLDEGIALHDPDGTLVLWNRTFENIYRSAPLNLKQGMSFEDVVTELGKTGLINHPGMTAEEWRVSRLALPRPNPQPVERQVDGRWYRIRETATPSGGMAILMMDITQLKQQQQDLIQSRDTLETRVAERTTSLANAVARAKTEASHRSEAETRLQDSEYKFRSIAEGAIQGFYVQHDFELVYANPALAKLLGYDSTDALLEMGNIAGFLSPSVREELEQRNRDRVAGLSPPPRYETRFLRKDGKEIWVELFVSQINWDNIPSVLVSVVDIDSQKRALDALAEAESDYRAIFEHASDGIYRSSLDGRNLRANPALARMNGFEDEEDVRNSHVDVEGSWYVKPSRREEFVETVMRDGEVRNFVSEVYRYRTREKIWISENARLIRDADGEPLFFEGTVRDITEQRKVEINLREAMAEAERANYAKSQFLAKMSHELRTPLNAIIGFSDIISEQMMGPVGSDRYVSYADDIRGSGRHLLSLINDLLDLSRIESGEVELELRPLDIGEIMDESASIVAPLANERRISVNVASETGGLRALADRRSLKQILLNLLSNAVKFNRDGGWIEVKAAEADGFCKIEIIDSGIGIRQEDMHSLFTPFGQVGNQMIAEHAGTGLGLPIVKSLIELHGGTVKVRSRPNEGTTVTVELPIAA